MTIEFGGVDFHVRKGKMAPSAHLVLWTGEGEDRQKWRLCLTVNADGTWQWAPGPPSHIVIPGSVTAAITAKVQTQIGKSSLAVSAVP